MFLEYYGTQIEDKDEILIEEKDENTKGCPISFRVGTDRILTTFFDTFLVCF